ILKKDYELMKYRLGRLPMMVDFLEQGGREPYSFVEYSKESYYSFSKKVDPTHPDLDSTSKKILAFYSREVLNARRIEEVVLLSLLVNKGKASKGEIKTIIQEKFNYVPHEETLLSAMDLLNGSFLKDADQKKYGIEKNISREKSSDGENFVLSESALQQLNQEPLHHYLEDLLRYAYKKFAENYKEDRFRAGLQLYEKYSRKDACRLLNWKKNEESTIYGYRIKHNTCPIFVTYEKSEDVVESQNYNDHFINSTCFNWMTRSRVTLNSPEVTSIKNHEETGLRIPLFVKKSDGEGSDFYYMGDLKPLEFRETTQNGAPIVNIIFHIQDEVDESLYNYFEDKSV
ncbi:MAG: DUF3427 domain-containing protein, partial [Anaerovoracaceae bacterium]